MVMGVVCGDGDAGGEGVGGCRVHVAWAGKGPREGEDGNAHFMYVLCVYAQWR